MYPFGSFAVCLWQLQFLSETSLCGHRCNNKYVGNDQYKNCTNKYFLGLDVELSSVGFFAMNTCVLYYIFCK